MALLGYGPPPVHDRRGHLRPPRYDRRLLQRREQLASLRHATTAELPPELHRALAPLGLGKKDIVANVNFFMNVPVDADGTMASSRAVRSPATTSSCGPRWTCWRRSRTARRPATRATVEPDADAYRRARMVMPIRCGSLADAQPRIADLAKAVARKIQAEAAQVSASTGNRLTQNASRITFLL